MLRSISVLHLKFLTSLSSHLWRGTKNLKKIRPVDPTTPFWGYFGIHDMGHAKVYLCTKLEVSSFTHLKIMEGSQNSKIRPMDLHHAPFRDFCHPSEETSQGLTVYQILNF